jgi:16S rRNA (guanine527-N7)-methyltransferase
MYSFPDWLNVSRETGERLIAFKDEVLRWNNSINLVSKQSVSNLWERHILDSAQIYPHVHSDKPLLDLGSGGGFPGIVLAIMGAQQVTLVEADQRKAAFLREASRLLSLNVGVIAKRIESMEPQNAQTITARALSPLSQLLRHAHLHLHKSGTAIFPKGRNAAAEIKEAQKLWRFEHTQITSYIDPESQILVIKNIEER